MFPINESGHSETKGGRNEKNDHLWNIFRNIQELIRFADQKIQVLFVISGLLSTIVFRQALDAIYISLFQKIFVCIYLCGFIVFVVMSLIALIARSKKVEDMGIVRHIYFGHVVKNKKPMDYINSVLNLDNSEIEKDLACQIYEISQIAKTKFKYYKYAWYVLIVQLFAFLCLVAWKLF